eukprot:Lithocolla_globosa_v1_NODE_6696_length_1048_cov_19.923464.p1 type:complete len:322 gc:universal NODE_6696_length_1048_cov_19.923464:1004-39(-)
MATRSRTALFTQYRNSYASQHSLSKLRRPPSVSSDPYSEHRALVGDSEVLEMENLTTAPVWAHRNYEIQEKINMIKVRVVKLEKLHKAAEKAVLDEDQLPHEIEITTKDITAAVVSCQSDIKKLSTYQKKNEGAEEMTMRKNAQSALAQQLQDVSTSFRKSQRAYLDRLKGRENKFKDQFAMADEKDSALSDEQYADPGFTQNQMAMLRTHEAVIEEREKGITQIAQSINELAEIFREMQTLVIDQGTILDRIDYNVEMALADVKKGVKDIEESQKYQKKYRTKLCILLLISVVTALVLFLFLSPQYDGDDNNTSTVAPPP